MSRILVIAAVPNQAYNLVERLRDRGHEVLTLSRVYSLDLKRKHGSTIAGPWFKCITGEPEGYPTNMELATIRVIFLFGEQEAAKVVRLTNFHNPGLSEDHRVRCVVVGKGDAFKSATRAGAFTFDLDSEGQPGCEDLDELLGRLLTPDEIEVAPLSLHRKREW